MAVHLFNRERPWSKLRLWTNGSSPDGRILPATAVTVEWLGQPGHPTSYALLGVDAAKSGLQFCLPEDAALFVGSLADVADEVVFELPDEYKRAIESVLGEASAPGWRVLVAAHGVYGSSYRVFERTAGLLERIYPAGSLIVDPETVWRLFDEAKTSRP